MIPFAPRFWLTLAAVLASALLSGCVSPPQPKDYTAYQAHFPRSILILPPINESTDVEGAQSYYATTVVPVAEQGYYVFPPVLVERMFRDNGLPYAPDMHAVAPTKLREIFGADAALYLTLLDYGTKYVVISSNTTVSARARLVDTATGTLLWEGTATVTQSSGDGGGGLVGALVSAVITQIVNTQTDAGYNVSQMTNFQLFRLGEALLPGHRHLEHGRPPGSR